MLHKESLDAKDQQAYESQKKEFEEEERKKAAQQAAEAGEVKEGEHST